VAERNGVSKKTLQNIYYKDKKLKRKKKRFIVEDGELRAILEDYKNPYIDEVSELYYQALELVSVGKSDSRDYELAKELARISGLRKKVDFKKEQNRIFQHLYRFSFKHESVALELIDLLKTFISQHLFGGLCE
jgi:hypothetical protein